MSSKEEKAIKEYYLIIKINKIIFMIELNLKSYLRYFNKIDETTYEIIFQSKIDYYI